MDKIKEGRPRKNPSFEVDCEGCGPTTTTLFRRGYCVRCYGALRRNGHIEPRQINCLECKIEMVVVGPRKYCEPCAQVRKYQRSKAFNAGHKLDEWRENKQNALEIQDGKCAICGTKEKLHYDHNHETGLFRGMLCGNCNRGIGMFGDDPQRLRKAAEYLNG